MTKRELYDIINEEIVNFKKGTINEELNERDEEIKKLREELRVERERNGYKKEND